MVVGTKLNIAVFISMIIYTLITTMSEGRYFSTPLLKLSIIECFPTLAAVQVTIEVV